MTLVPKSVRAAAAHDEYQCPVCYDSGIVCDDCVRRYEGMAGCPELDEIRRQAAFRRRLQAARLSGGERFALALLAVFVVFLAAVFGGNRELASVAAYGLFIGGGAVAAWSLGRSLW